MKVSGFYSKEGETHRLVSFGSFVMQTHPPITVTVEKE